MPSQPLATPAPSRTAVRALAAGLLGLALAMGARASPADEPVADPVLRLLHEGGFLDRRTEAPTGLAAEASDWAAGLIGSAMQLLGVPYRRGGQSVEHGFDCSGFTRHVFESSLGLVLPRRSKEQARAPGWLKVQREELRPGDLVFFNTLRSTFSHVGIYVGEGKFIHAPRTGAKVRVEDMRAAYWSKRFNGARRAPPATGPAPLAEPVPVAGAEDTASMVPLTPVIAPPLR
jgi:cell wall-associated NlpC family hydrolase